MPFYRHIKISKNQKKGTLDVKRHISQPCPQPIPLNLINITHIFRNNKLIRINLKNLKLRHLVIEAIKNKRNNKKSKLEITK